MRALTPGNLRPGPVINDRNRGIYRGTTRTSRDGSVVVVVDPVVATGGRPGPPRTPTVAPSKNRLLPARDT